MQTNPKKMTIKEVQRVLDAAGLIDEVLTPKERLALRKLIEEQGDTDSVDPYVLLSILDGETPNNR